MGKKITLISLVILTLINCENKDWLNGKLTKEDENSIHLLVNNYILESTNDDFQENRKKLDKFFSPDFDFFFPGEIFEAYVYDSYSIKRIEFDTERKEYKVSVVFHLSWGIDKRTIEKIQISSPQNLWITKSKGKWKIKSIYKPDIFSKEGIKKFAIRYQKDFPEMSKDILEKF